MWQILQALLRQASIGQSRTSVINPLQWTLVIVIVAFLGLVFGHSPSWVLVFFAVVIGAVVLLLILAFIYFALKSPDSLRSETYSIVKTAMEKRFVGDNLTGLKELVDMVEGSETKALAAGPVESIEPNNG